MFLPAIYWLVFGHLRRKLIAEVPGSFLRENHWIFQLFHLWIINDGSPKAAGRTTTWPRGLPENTVYRNNTPGLMHDVCQGKHSHKHWVTTTCSECRNTRCGSYFPSPAHRTNSWVTFKVAFWWVPGEGENPDSHIQANEWWSPFIHARHVAPAPAREVVLSLMMTLRLC